MNDDELLLDLPDQELTEEEREAVENLMEAYSKVVYLSMSRVIGIPIRYYDSEHVSVNGQIMTNEDFDLWMEENGFWLDEEDSYTRKVYDA